MIILDVNILLYAYNADDPLHAQAASWVENLFARTELIGLPWATLWSFLRISTSARIWSSPKSVREAFTIIGSLLANPNVRVVHPGPQHAEILERLVTEHQAAGPLVSDAVLAALALESGASLASCDQDFSRFSGLRWINPLA
jgi:toxin-antitoxin system PIN domain toxin